MTRSMCLRVTLSACFAAALFACGGDSESDTPTPISLSLTVDPPRVEVGETQQWTAVGTLADGVGYDYTTKVTWTSSDESLVRIDGNGLATVLGPGEVTITASFKTVAAEGAGGSFCKYPNFPNDLRFGNVVPPLAWDGAYQPDGTQFDFSFEDVYCDSAWERYSTIVVVIGAGWCSACTLFTQDLNTFAQQVDDAGGLILYVEAQDSNFGPADNEFSFSHIRRLIGEGIGIRVGDLDTKPQANYISGLDIVEAFPTVFVVRTRDMRLIANRSRSRYELPVLDIVRNPEADWSNSTAPTFRNNCGGGDDEASEPNNTVAQAAEIGPGTYSGGICDPEPDFYEIGIAGAWQVTVDFSHSTGDLDVFVWDDALDQPLLIGNEIVGGSSDTDNERFSHEGPATIMVRGHQGASAPYTLILEEL